MSTTRAVRERSGVGYDAFLSYSHAADGRLAPALQSGLQHLAKPWYRRRALRVFRDETGLSTNPHLWPSIVAALDESEWFVLLASPEAAASEWVNRELAYWLETKSADRILPVVTSGEWVWDRDAGVLVGDAVPERLRAALANEPRHLDLRWAAEETDLDLRNSGFRSAVADLAAPMHGVAKDELEGEDIRQHRRARRLARVGVTAVVVLLVVAVAFGGLAVRARDDAAHQTYIARLRRAAAQAVADASIDPARSMLIAAEVQRRWNKPETRSALLSTLLTDGPLTSVRRTVGSPITAAAIANDGSTVATVDAHGVVDVLDTLRGRVLGRFMTGSRSTVNVVAISPDRALVATGDQAGNLNIRRSDGRSSCPPQHLGDLAVATAAFADSGRVVVAQDDAALETVAVDVARCTVVGRLPTNSIITTLGGVQVAASRTSDRVAFAGSPIQIWDARLSHLMLTKLLSANRSVRSLVYSRDGSRLIVADEEELHILDATTGVETRPPITFMRSKPDRVTVAPNGKAVAVSLADRSIEVVTLEADTTQQRSLVGLTSSPLAVAFSPDNAHLVAISANETAHWDLRQLAPAATMPAFDLPTYAVTWSHDSKWLLAAAEDGAVHQIAAHDGHIGTRIAVATPAVHGIALGVTGITLAPDGSWIATTSDTDGTLVFTDMQSGARVRAPLQLAPRGSVYGAFGPYGLTTDGPERTLVTTTALGDVVAIDTASSRKRWRRSEGLEGEFIKKVALSVSGDVVYTSDKAGVVALSSTTGRPVANAPARSRITGLAADPLGKRVAVAFADATIQILDGSTLRTLDTLVSPDGDVQTLRFVDNAGLLGAATRNGTVQLWDLATHRVIGISLPPPSRNTGALGATDLELSPDGATLAVSYHPGGVVFWSMNPEAWRRRACEIAGRELTHTEWVDAFGPSEPYRPTCTEK